MIVEAITKYMNDNNIKQKYLAEQTGLSKQCICTMLNGKRKIYIDDYIKICDALNLNYDFFFSSP